MGSRFDLAGPGRAQPGVNFLALLLWRLDDALLGPAADLVRPALAVRSEVLAEDAAPAAPGNAADHIAVDVGRALVIEDAAAMPLGTLPRPGACTGGSRLWLPGLRLAFQKGRLAAKTWWAQLGSNQ